MILPVGLQNMKEPILKLKGLPFKASENDIKNFFPDLEIVSVEVSQSAFNTGIL